MFYQGFRWEKDDRTRDRENVVELNKTVSSTLWIVSRISEKNDPVVDKMTRNWFLMENVLSTRRRK